MLVCDIWIFAKESTHVAVTGCASERLACSTVFTYIFIWESETNLYSLGRESNIFSQHKSVYLLFPFTACKNSGHLVLIKSNVEPWLGGSVGWSAHQKVAGSIPGQCIYLGCGFDPRSGHIWRQLIGVSLSYQCFSLCTPQALLSLK